MQPEQGYQALVDQLKQDVTELVEYPETVHQFRVTEGTFEFDKLGIRYRPDLDEVIRGLEL